MQKIRRNRGFNYDDILADGIDVWKFKNFDFGKKKLLSAPGAESLPTKEQAIILAASFADFIANPH